MNAELPVQENTKGTTHVRWMIRRDMPEVLAIEEESSEFPWKEDDFIAHLNGRRCIGMVIEYRTEEQELDSRRASAIHKEIEELEKQIKKEEGAEKMASLDKLTKLKGQLTLLDIGGEIMGFMIYEINNESINVLKFVVKKGYRRLGIGTAMVNKLFMKLTPRRIKITIGVSSSVQPFFEKYEFTKTPSFVLRLDRESVPASVFTETSKFSTQKIDRRSKNIFRGVAILNEEDYMGERALMDGLVALVPNQNVVSALEWAAKTLQETADREGKRDELKVALEQLEKSSKKKFAAGFILVSPRMKIGCLSEIKDIFVTSNYHDEKEAVKKALLQSLIGFAFDWDINISAIVQEKDLPLFESLGFKQVGQIMEYTFNENTPRPPA